MPFPGYKIFEQYEPDKYKTTTRKKVEKVLAEAKKEGLAVKEAKEILEFQEARELFGKDYLGPEAVETTFGVTLTPEELQEVEKIPFSREELEQAKKLGMMLVLRVSHDEKGKPLTINEMRKRFNKEDSLGDPKKKKSQMFYRKMGEGWYDKEEFATKATADLGWGLVMKSVLPESTNKNWEQQEQVLKQWAEKNNLDPSTVKRRTPVEAVYDELVYYGANKGSLLEDKYDWTGVQSSDGDLVLVGYFGARGLYVSLVHRAYSDSLLGVCPAR